jgi:hypothetical protein
MPTIGVTIPYLRLVYFISFAAFSAVKSLYEHNLYSIEFT